MKLNLDKQFYCGIPLRLIDRGYFGMKARRYVVNDTNQNVWIPCKHLHDDGTIRSGENIDYIFNSKTAKHKLELAGLKGGVGMHEVTIQFDGSCLGNPGPGGFAAIVECKGTEKIASGYELDTTNNRMELMGLRAGLRLLTKPCIIKVYGDSQYVVQGCKEWLAGWKAKGWKTANKGSVANKELWQELDELISKHQIEFIHNYREHNERCDTLAKEQAYIAKSIVETGSK
jgi:ribonuclease HI